MDVHGSCHCGGVHIELPSKPAWVADCNCSLCRRLAWRVAYYPPEQVRISGETTAYVWGDRMIGIHHCPICGCGTHWRSLGEDFGKMGVNARLLDGFDEGDVEVRQVDNAEKEARLPPLVDAPNKQSIRHPHQARGQPRGPSRAAKQRGK